MYVCVPGTPVQVLQNKNYLFLRYRMCTRTTWYIVYTIVPGCIFYCAVYTHTNSTTYNTLALLVSSVWYALTWVLPCTCGFSSILGGCPFF